MHQSTPACRAAGRGQLQAPLLLLVRGQSILSTSQQTSPSQTCLPCSSPQAQKGNRDRYYLNEFIPITIKSDCHLGLNQRLSALAEDAKCLWCLINLPVPAPYPGLVKSESQGVRSRRDFGVSCLSSPGDCNVQSGLQLTGQRSYYSGGF